MPRRKRREEDLIHSAIEALEDEVRCWREGPPLHYGREPHIRLIRYPRMDLSIGPADFDAQSTQTIEHVDLARSEVPFFLRWRGMEAAIKKIRELEGRDRPPAPRDLARIDETARIEDTGRWMAP